METWKFEFLKVNFFFCGTRTRVKAQSVTDSSLTAFDLIMIDCRYQLSSLFHKSPIHPDHSVAELVAKLVFKIWSRPTPASEGIVSDFISFVLKVITSSSPNISPSMILTSLLYVKRLRISTKLQIPLGNRCEFRIWLTALM